MNFFGQKEEKPAGPDPLFAGACIDAARGRVLRAAGLFDVSVQRRQGAGHRPGCRSYTIRIIIALLTIFASDVLSHP